MRKRTTIVSSLVLGAAAGSSFLAAGRPALADPPATPPVTVTGYVEANYSYNFNEPGNGNTGIFFNDKNAQFALNLADLRVGRAATDTSRVGFQIRAISGEAEKGVFGADAISDGGIRILEGYGTILAPWGGKDVKIDVGQFVTHIGYETIEVGSDNFFSKSWVFAIPEPLYHDGVRAAFPLTPKLTGGLYLYNAYNGSYDTNRDIAPGFSLALAPNSNVSWILNGLTGREPQGFGSRAVQQSILNLIGSDQFTKSFKGVVEGVYRWGDYMVSNGESSAMKKSYNSWGVAAYGIFTQKSGDILSLRGDYYTVSKGDTGLLTEADTDKPYIASATLSYEPVTWMKKYPNLRTLLEYREDFAKKDLFIDKSGNGTKKNQGTFTIGEVYSF